MLKPFNSIVISVLHNYFDDSTKLFSNLYKIICKRNCISFLHVQKLYEHISHFPKSCKSFEFLVFRIYIRETCEVYRKEQKLRRQDIPNYFTL